MRQPKKPRFKRLIMAFTAAATLSFGGYGYFNAPPDFNFTNDNSSAVASEYRNPGMSQTTLAGDIRTEGDYSVITGRDAKALQWYINQNPGLPPTISEEMLRQAASIGEKNMVSVLIRAPQNGLIAPFNLNASESHANSALVQAARTNRADIAEILIENGADINARDVHGATALGTAAYYKNYDTAKYLIEAGAIVQSPISVTADDAAGRLLRAHILDQIPGDVFANDSLDAFKFMAENQKLMVSDYADTLLQKAVEANAPKLVQFALDVGANPDHELVMKAAANNRSDIASVIEKAHEKMMNQQGPSGGSSSFRP